MRKAKIASYPARAAGTANNSPMRRRRTGLSATEKASARAKTTRAEANDDAPEWTYSIFICVGPGSHADENDIAWAASVNRAQRGTARSR